VDGPILLDLDSEEEVGSSNRYRVFPFVEQLLDMDQHQQPPLLPSSAPQSGTKVRLPLCSIFPIQSRTLNLIPADELTARDATKLARKEDTGNSKVK